MACKFIWVESCFGWKIILLIGKWATCRWLLKCDLKTNTYGIWFLYVLFASKFLNFQSIYGIFMSFHDSTWFIFEFLFKLAHMSLLKVFMQYLRFLDFYMSNDPKLELDLRKLAEFRLVRFLVARTVRGYGADSPPFIRIVHQRLCREVVNRRNSLRTVRQRTADSPPVLGSICQRQFQSGGSVKIQRRTVR